MGEEGVPGVGGVKGVLGEDERAGGGGGPGVDQGDLDDVDLLGHAGDVGAGLVVDDLDAGEAIEVSGEVAEGDLHGADDRVVDLDAGDVLLVEDQGGEEVASAARADHEDVESGRRKWAKLVTSYLRKPAWRLGGGDGLAAGLVAEAGDLLRFLFGQGEVVGLVLLLADVCGRCRLRRQ